MRGAIALSFIFILVATLLLFFYWFVPINTANFEEFKPKLSNNYNFSLNGDVSPKEMQFYENMRYPDKNIYYKIYRCPIQKRDGMMRAFDMISNLTVLNFYSVASGEEEISVTCDSKNKIEGGLFIAGEGGPSNITQAGNFNVINNGKILLIKKIECNKPIVEIHELLHALGFNHSNNPSNVMYPVAKCGQTIGDEIPLLINNLYSVKSLPDLTLENVSALMNGKYLDLNMTIRNNGLKASENSNIIIYVDEKQIKKIFFEGLDVGYGKKIMLSNIWVPKINIKKIEVLIDYNSNELDKSNNKASLFLIEN